MYGNNFIKLKHWEASRFYEKESMLANHVKDWKFRLLQGL